MSETISGARAREAAPPAERYFNRELSWLAFNRRVLETARDERWPILERVRFLSIVSSNLDEFFMVRVASLRRQIAAGSDEPSPDGLAPREAYAAIHAEAYALLEDQAHCFCNEIEPALAAQGITLVPFAQLSPEEQEAAGRYFERDVFPLLTPLVVDPGHPFTHIPSQTLNLALVICNSADDERFARVTIPPSVPRLLDLAALAGDASGPRRFLWLDELLAAHADALFPGTTIEEVHPFRIIRDAEGDLEEGADDLLHSVEEHVQQRRFGGVVGLFVGAAMPQRLLALLLEHLETGEEEIYQLDAPLELGALEELVALDRPDLKNPPFTPRIPAGLRPSDDIFATIRRGDVLLHHPYDSFESVVDWLNAAATDPAVLTIKQTLYRVGHDSPVVAALMRACAAGKQVAVLVELTARFDEQPNIEWARALEQGGAQVVYGVVGLKTHCKLALVVRREDEGLRSYAHIGTGNYNAATAKAYTDLGLLTCDPTIAADVAALFNRLTGYAEQQTYERLLVAPEHLRPAMLELIEREVEQHQQSGEGRLIFKLNALVDPEIIDALYNASQAGVQIDLVVRGICCLRPGVPGMSEAIRVRSIVGRFLEHSRAYYFRNGGDEQVYIGSADMMQRNLDRRVEALCPVLDADLRAALIDDVLGTLLADTTRAWHLHADGSYILASEA